MAFDMKLTLRLAAAMPLQIPLMAFLMLALAASTLLASKHAATPQPGYVIADESPRATPFGSGAAIRNLLF